MRKLVEKKKEEVEEMWKEDIVERYSKEVLKKRCDCGHFKEDHYRGEGFCSKCACAWFYPCIEYVKRKEE